MAWFAVMVIILTTSSTEHPLDRSVKQEPQFLAKLDRSLERLKNVLPFYIRCYQIVNRGKPNTFACQLRYFRRFASPTDGTKAASACNSPSICILGANSFAITGSLYYFISQFIVWRFLWSKKLSIAHSWFKSSGPRLVLSCWNGYLCQFFCCWIGVYCAIGKDEQSVFAILIGWSKHQQGAGYYFDSRYRFYNLKSRAQHVTGRIPCSASSPSASPFLIIKHPKYNGSLDNFCASSGVIPFSLRKWYNKSAYSFNLGLFSGPQLYQRWYLLTRFPLLILEISSLLPSNVSFAAFFFQNNIRCRECSDFQFLREEQCVAHCFSPLISSKSFIIFLLLKYFCLNKKIINLLKNSISTKVEKIFVI